MRRVGRFEALIQSDRLLVTLFGLLSIPLLTIFFLPPDGVVKGLFFSLSNILVTFLISSLILFKTKVKIPISVQVSVWTVYYLVSAFLISSPVGYHSFLVISSRVLVFLTLLIFLTLFFSVAFHSIKAGMLASVINMLFMIAVTVTPVKLLYFPSLERLDDIIGSSWIEAFDVMMLLRFLPLITTIYVISLVFGSAKEEEDISYKVNFIIISSSLFIFSAPIKFILSSY